MPCSIDTIAVPTQRFSGAKPHPTPHKRGADRFYYLFLHWKLLPPVGSYLADSWHHHYTKLEGSQITKPAINITNFPHFSYQSQRFRHYSHRGHGEISTPELLGIPISWNSWPVAIRSTWDGRSIQWTMFLWRWRGGQALYLSLRTLVKTGDEVILFEPFFVIRASDQTG